jgi:hypothetical protein
VPSFKIILLNRKRLDKISHPVLIKIKSSKPGMDGNSLKKIKDIYKNAGDHILLLVKTGCLSP